MEPHLIREQPLIYVNKIVIFHNFVQNAYYKFSKNMLYLYRKSSVQFCFTERKSSCSRHARFSFITATLE